MVSGSSSNQVSGLTALGSTICAGAFSSQSRGFVAVGSTICNVMTKFTWIYINSNKEIIGTWQGKWSCPTVSQRWLPYCRQEWRMCCLITTYLIKWTSLFPLIPVVRLLIIGVIDLLWGVDGGCKVFKQWASVGFLVVDKNGESVVWTDNQRVQMRLLVFVDVVQTLTVDGLDYLFFK